MKRILTIGLFLVLCIGLCSCSLSDTGSESKKEKKSSSDSKDKDKKDTKDNKDNNDSDGGLGDLLGGLKDSKESDQPDVDEKAEESGDAKDTGSSDSDSKKSDRNIVHKFYELVSVDGHTRDEFLSNEDLADSYGMWDFYAYGSGVEVSFDYDTGYVQYTWYIVSTNAFSSAPVDNPSAVDCILDYTMFLNAGDEPDRIPISVSYSDDTIVQTFTEGGGVCIYKLSD